MSDLNISKEHEANFKPKARLLLQLGDQLIKNESIALVELVKNSYDADANIVNIYMENVENKEEGVIIIEDDGFGMTPEIVEDVWLEPGSDFKSKQIKNKEKTPKYKRLPIGEKGIGRFGVHKLGNIIELTTKAKNSNEVYVKINWEHFDEYDYLSDVPITIIERKEPKLFSKGKTGTNITISKLRESWTRGMARNVKRSINALSSPFDRSDFFQPNYEVVDKPKWFDGIMEWEDIQEYSLFNFDITLSGSKIEKFEYNFTPWNTMSKVFPNKITEEANIVSNYINLEYPNSFEKEVAGKTIHLNNYNIGEINFKGYVFDRDSFVMKMGVSDKSGFKGYLNSNGGVRVFRDNLRVYDYGERENDWLGLDYRRFQQPAKRISNNILIGAVSLQRSESGDLQEKTNREGFKENNAYQAFKGAILHCIEIIEIIRAQDKRKLKERYGPTPKSAPVMSTLNEAKQFVHDKVKESNTQKTIINYFDKIEADYKALSKNLLKAAGAGLSMSVVVHEVEKIIYEVNTVLKKEKASERVLKLVEHLSSLIDGYSEIIRTSDQQSSNLLNVVEQAIFNVEYRLQSHQIEVIKGYKEKKPNFPNVKIAKNLLIGSIMNIIDNSIYWLDRKKINKIENNEKFIKKLFIDIVVEEKTINIIIADNGTGFMIPTEDMIEPFVTAKSGGIGLGLHIASEIMEAQKGRLIFPDEGDFDIPDEFKEGASVVFEFKK
ncbi:sensor histidine kinase [Mesonia aquimarina]|uniref:sensor histidine kinase n=1 Tax=Mesonia aquimarina TaxID=1504967 RepID=UPI000EF57171|nr:sensor histidine kinase [Mesonia aquimarina]